MRIKFLEKKKREITYSQVELKIIATISMFIDHVAIMLIINGKLYGYDESLFANAIKLPEAQKWLILYRICRIIGRLAFPIFALLIVEGFRKTSNLFKYGLRILLLAFISEIPFNLMVYNKVFCFETQNVLFTYFIGLVMLVIIKLLRNFSVVIHMVIAALAGVACHFLRTDYAIEGILLIFVLYTFRQDLYTKCILVAIILFVSTLQYDFGLGIIAIYFIFFYDGSKGLWDIKRFAYLFYPMHMLLLYGIVYFSYLH